MQQFLACKQASRTATSHQTSVGHTICTYIYSAFLLDSFSHIEGDLHINVCTSWKECRPRPGASIKVRRWATAQGTHFLQFTGHDIIRKKAFWEQWKQARRQTMVFTVCKLKPPPHHYFINLYRWWSSCEQNRLRTGTAWCNTWIVSNQTVQTLIKWSVMRHFIWDFSDYQTTRYGFPF